MPTAKKPAPKKGQTGSQGDPVAVHLQSEDGVDNIIALGNIRVIITRDEDAWFAQGLELDYAAQGNSIEDVKKAFETGLEATIQDHLQIHGSIRGMLKTAPPDVWAEMLYEPSAHHNRFSQVSIHALSREGFPFAALEFRELVEA